MGNYQTVLEKVLKGNSTKQNLYKAIEELNELSTVLTQKLSRPGQINDEDIEKEIADVKIRICILEKIFNKENIDRAMSNKLFKLNQKFTVNEEQRSDTSF